MKKNFFTEFDEIAKTDSHKEHIAQYRDNIESAVSAQFNDIVEEASKDSELPTPEPEQYLLTSVQTGSKSL